MSCKAPFKEEDCESICSNFVENSESSANNDESAEQFSQEDDFDNFLVEEYCNDQIGGLSEVCSVFVVSCIVNL